MIFAPWVVALFISLILVSNVIGFWGWMKSDLRNEKLSKENKALIKENTKLKGKLSLARLYIDTEEKK